MHAIFAFMLVKFEPLISIDVRLRLRVFLNVKLYVSPYPGHIYIYISAVAAPVLQFRVKVNNNYNPDMHFL